MKTAQPDRPSPKATTPPKRKAVPADYQVYVETQDGRPFYVLAVLDAPSPLAARDRALESIASATPSGAKVVAVTADPGPRRPHLSRFRRPGIMAWPDDLAARNLLAVPGRKLRPAR